MSIPLVQEATKDAINTSIIAIKRNIERINMLLGLVDSGSPDLSGLATKQELEDAITQVETDLAPVDEVTSGNMQSVTSNAVAVEFNKYLKQNGSNVGDRNTTSVRQSAILNILTNNPNIMSFSICYNGGYVYGYFTNRGTSNQEKSVLEINPYEGKLYIWYVNNTLTSITLQRTI
jgi:hypothetical protein